MYYEDSEEIEKIFNKDVRDKKFIGKNIKYRKNRVFSDTVLLHSDFLSKKDIEKLNGEMRVYNMFDDYSWEQIKALPKEKQLNAIEYLKSKHGSTRLMAEALGIKTQNIFDKLYILRHNGTTTNKQKTISTAPISKNVKPKTENIPKEQEPMIYDSKFSIRLIGEMTTEEVQERVLNIANVLLKNMKYQISFEVKEIGKNEIKEICKNEVKEIVYPITDEK